jgi:hypothetical protein
MLAPLITGWQLKIRPNAASTLVDSEMVKIG